MLLILRKLRRSFFPLRQGSDGQVLPGKVRTYMAYALGEIILIVVGILLALHISEWNKNRLSRIEEIKILDRIVANVESDISTMDFQLQYTKGKEESLLRLKRAFAEGKTQDPLFFLKDLAMGARYGWTQAGLVVVTLLGTSIKIKMLFIFRKIRRSFFQLRQGSDGRVLPGKLRTYLALSACILVVCLSASASTQTIDLSDLERLHLHKVVAEAATHDGRSALRVTEAEAHKDNTPDKLVVIKEFRFKNGVIEVDMAGQPVSGATQGARGFIGVAFHINEDASKYECIYLRPTNGRANDQLRRNHSAQYVSHPDFHWRALRESEPGKYESYVDLVPGEWTRVRIEVSGTKARLFVHGAEQPTLIVNDLKMGETNGAIALRIGPGTEGYFRNLRVTKDE